MDAPKDLEVISTAMATVGFALLFAENGPMDSGVADFSDGFRTIRVIKDRSQWMLKGVRDQLEPFGLWRAFDDTQEFRAALLTYVARTSV